MTSLDIRAALERHWAASDASDFETEHEIYCDDAILIIRSQENESVAGDKSSFHGPLSRTKSGSTLNASWAQMIFGSQNLCFHMMASRRTWSALWNFMADK
jgi:ketosteroid isomerase-like protein